MTYRADILAGSVLHECLTGSEPYKADSVSVVITSHLMQPIPKPSELRPGFHRVRCGDRAWPKTRGTLRQRRGI